MLKIHKSHSKKLLLISITSICIVAGLLGFYYLTYTPELSHAETVTTKKTLADIEYMQDVTADICANTPEADTAGNHQYQLKDSRDQKTYWVAKLKDGNCWMTQNLAIMDTLITVADSDIDSGEFTIPKSTNTGFTSTYEHQPKAHYDDYYKSGYYNWYTATAGTGNLNTASGNVSSSICPRQWQLPFSSGSKSYNALFLTYGIYKQNTLLYGSQNITNTPLNFIYSGNFNNSQLSAGSQGLYWTSTAAGTSSAYTLFFDTGIRTAYSWSRDRGVPIPCVISNNADEMDNNIEIAINNTISLDVTNEVIVNKSNTNPSTAAFSALVASNQPYSVSISSASPNMASSTSSATILSKSGLLNTNENAWGIKLSTNITYEQITTTPKLFYSSTSPESKTLPFTIGISTTPDLPAGEYSTNIAITATQN